jgi:predicted aspartyl protease
MRFLIDTGTNPTIVDMRTAQALGMHGELVGLALFDRKLPVEKTVLSQLDLGPIRKQAIPVVISDLKFLEKDVVGHVDAILGLAVLGDRNFTLDYKQKELVFGAVENKRAVPFASDPPFVTVQVEFGGQPLSLLVDTGTSGLVLFQSRIRGKLEQVRTNDYSHAKHIGGQFGYETVILPESRFGKADMGPVAAFVVQDKAEDKRQFDGLMGIPFLHPRRLSFDFQKHTLSWSGSW